MRCCGREERGCSSCGCGGCSCTACAGCGSGGGGGGGGKAHPPCRSDPEGVRGRDPLPTSASPTRQPRLQQQLLLPQRPLQRRVRRHPCVGRCRKSGFLFVWFVPSFFLLYWFLRFVYRFRARLPSAAAERMDEGKEISNGMGRGGFLLLENHKNRSVRISCVLRIFRNQYLLGTVGPADEGWRLTKGGD
jgi:hypothetical protein